MKDKSESNFIHRRKEAQEDKRQKKDKAEWLNRNIPTIGLAHHVEENPPNSAMQAGSKVYLALLGVNLENGMSIPAAVRARIQAFAIDQVAMCEEMPERRKLALDHLKLPLKFEKGYSHMVSDQDGNSVFDVRGAGRLGHTAEGYSIMEAIGELITTSVNKTYHK